MLAPYIRGRRPLVAGYSFGGWPDHSPCLFRQESLPLQIRYFADTDTLYILFHEGEIAETRDLDENTLVEFEASGNQCAITVEHARERVELPHFSFEQAAA